MNNRNNVQNNPNEPMNVQMSTQVGLKYPQFDGR